MKVDVTIKGMDSVQHLLQRLSGPELAKATSAALNDTGYQVRRAMQAQFRSAFDRPTGYILRAPKVREATPEKQLVTILPTNASDRPGRGGKEGVDPQRILHAQAFGGRRQDKKSEVLLRRLGLLPAGFQTAIPKVPYPDSDDGHGNLRGSFLQRLLSYLNVHTEAGFRANMKAKARRRFEGARDYSNIRTRRKHQERAQRFFVVRPGWAETRHLAPGIWAARGVHGVDLRPVLMFVRTPSYQPRISMERLLKDVGVHSYLSRRLRFRIRQTAGV